MVFVLSQQRDEMSLLRNVIHKRPATCASRVSYIKNS